jgi:hypothetical protein
MAKKKRSGGSGPGYCNPPVHSRFQPGQSGNPGGRKKGSRNIKTLLKEVMETEAEVTDKANGTKRRVTLLEALLLRQVQDGLDGNSRSIENLLNRYERYADHSDDAREELPRTTSRCSRRPWPA